MKYTLKIVKDHPRWSVKMIWSAVAKKYADFIISEQHLSDVIRDNNITRKRTRQRHYPVLRYGKPIDFKKELKLFYKVVDKYSLSKIICIDETSIHAQMVNSYSRCELGKRCVHKTTDNKVFQKFTLVCAISSKGIVGWTLYQKGGMNAVRMCEFIDSFITNKLKNYLIIMDNGGPHKSSLIKSKITESKNTLQYSVPYRPKTNAIESFFNQFKHFYKLDDSSVSFVELKRNVKKSLNMISKANCNNYIKYAYQSKIPLKTEPTQSKSNRLRKPKKYKSGFL